MRNQSEPSNFAAIKTPISQEALDQLFCEARTHSTWLPEDATLARRNLTTNGPRQWCRLRCIPLHCSGNMRPFAL
jgi:hypothetical protein